MASSSTMASKKSAKNLLIVGLGNPGKKYAGTPHNAGFLVIDTLLTDYGIEAVQDNKLKSEIAEQPYGRKKIILAKPQTFMNDSGSAVKSLVTRYSLLVTESLWLIHDDVDLELGQLKIVRNRGSAGHKGVEDIMRKLRTKDFVRFRIGIRPKRVPQKRSKSLMNTFVVSQFTKQEQRLFAQIVHRSKEAVLLALAEGTEKAANKYNS